MLANSKGPAAWITALLLTLISALAEADVAAGVAAYQQRDYVTAIREFQEAAQRDDVRALNYLGIMHAQGVGTPRNDQQAAALFYKAALLGFPEATANLGRMHAEGRGVPQDNKAAVAAYRAAARAGFPPAIQRMAEIYEKGELGETPDAAVAREWRARLSDRTQPALASAPVQKTPEAAAATPPSKPDAAPEAAIARESRARLPDRQTPAATAAPPAVSAPVQEPPAAVVVTQPSGQVQRQPEPQANPVAPEGSTPAQNAIEAIAVTLQSGQILIKVRTKLPLAAPPAGFVVATPPRIAFDFADTDSGLGRHHEVGEGDLQSVDVIQGGGRTRMVLILRNMVQHDTKLDRHDLLITLTPPGRAGN